MSDTPRLGGVPAWAVRHAWAYLVVLHLLFAAVGPLAVVTRRPDLSSPAAGLVVVAGTLALVVQLRHSLAATGGGRPSSWPVTFAVLIGCTYAPMWRFGLDWMPTQWFVGASALMLLPGWPAVLGVAAPSVGAAIAAGVSAEPGPIVQVITWALYGLAFTALGAAALYGAARVVEMVDELRSARSELAELVIGRGRPASARELHDRLGHSLSAVSFKGDLAMRLLPGDPAAARAEIESLTGVARAALRDMRTAVRDEHVPSLPAELDAAAAVLDAAAISTSVAADVGPLAPVVEAVLAAAVREATSNVLRHSVATWCRFTTVRQDGLVRLDVSNNGAPSDDPRWDALDALAEQARALGGRAGGTRTGDGQFRLVVVLPEGGP